MSYKGECPYTIRDKGFEEEYTKVCYRAQKLNIPVKQFGPWNFELPLGMGDIQVLDEMCKIRECRMRNKSINGVYDEPSGYSSELRKNANECSIWNEIWHKIDHKKKYMKCMEDIKS